jgi:hypothetical protein
MPKLTREPCITCGTDTMHKTGICLTCNTVAPRQSDFYGKVAKLRRREFAHIKAKYGSKFTPLAAAAMVSKKFNVRELEAGRKLTSQRNRPAANEPAYVTSTFGRGRERTKA